MNNEELILIKDLIEKYKNISNEELENYNLVLKNINTEIIKNNLKENVKKLSKICPRCKNPFPINAENRLFTRQGICCLKCNI